MKTLKNPIPFDVVITRGKVPSPGQVLTVGSQQVLAKKVTLLGAKGKRKVVRVVGVAQGPKTIYVDLAARRQVPPIPSSILAEALEITGGARRRDYDHARPNHERIASLWNAYLGIRKDGKAPISAGDAATMMLLLKLARHVYTPKRDNLVDVAGYARCLSQIDGFEP